MKIKFKYEGNKRELWAERDNVFGARITAQPNINTLTFVSIDGSIKIDMTIDERHSLAGLLAEQGKNEIFEFDFSQPLPEKRLN